MTAMHAVEITNSQHTPFCGAWLRLCMPRISFMSGSKQENRPSIPCTAVKVNRRLSTESERSGFSLPWRKSREETDRRCNFYRGKAVFTPRKLVESCPSLRNECRHINGAYLHKSIEKEG